MGKYLKLVPDAPQPTKRIPSTLQPVTVTPPCGNEWDGRYIVGPAETRIAPPGFHCQFCRRLWIALFGMGWPHQKLTTIAMFITTADRIIIADRESILVRPPLPQPPLRLWRVETSNPAEKARRREIERLTH